MENKVVFVDGLNVYTPSATLLIGLKLIWFINPTKLIKWLEQNDQYLKEGKHGLEVRLQVKQSAQGKLYASVDTYEPKLKAEVTSKSVTVDDGDLPF
jgi:hypothetical protein